VRAIAWLTRWYERAVQRYQVEPGNAYGTFPSTVGAYHLQSTQGIAPPSQCKLHRCVARPVCRKRVNFTIAPWSAFGMVLTSRVASMGKSASYRHAATLVAS
jgi:hypothetical protein